MIVDELYRAVRALVACKGLTQEEALEHLLAMDAQQRARVSRALREWSVVASDDDGVHDTPEVIRAVPGPVAAAGHRTPHPEPAAATEA